MGFLAAARGDTSPAHGRTPTAVRRTVLRGAARAAVIAAALGAASCETSHPTSQFAADRDELIAAFRAESEAVRERKALREKAAIRQLSVRRDPAGGSNSFLVTADLERAPVALVVRRLLDETRAPFSLGDVGLAGTATVRFQDLGLEAALNDILSAESIYVARRDGVLVFQYGVPPSDEGAADGSDGESGDTGGRVRFEVVLRHLPLGEAVALLDSVYAGAEGLNYGGLPHLNAVYLSGSSAMVSDARTFLARADRKVPHVFIETLVVDMDTLASKSLGAELTDGATGDVSNVTIAPGSSTGTIGFSLLQGLQSPTQLTMMIDLLVSEDSAEVLSRPYIATRSNQQARIEITTDQYVAVQQSIDGAAITTSDGISAGVKLNVTPVVQGDEIIRLDISVEQSQFVPSVGDTLVQLERNSASTSVSVESGQTIAIGGLNFSNRLRANSGIPYLRNIPGVNLGATDLTEQRIGRELVVYITPTIWEPQIDTPLIRPDLPTSKSPEPFDKFRKDGADRK